MLFDENETPDDREDTEATEGAEDTEATEGAEDTEATEGAEDPEETDTKEGAGDADDPEARDNGLSPSCSGDARLGARFRVNEGVGASGEGGFGRRGSDWEVGFGVFALRTRASGAELGFA